jgi:hypothetical protein
VAEFTEGAGQLRRRRCPRRLDRKVPDPHHQINHAHLRTTHWHNYSVASASLSTPLHVSFSDLCDGLNLASEATHFTHDTTKSQTLDRDVQSSRKCGKTAAAASRLACQRSVCLQHFIHMTIRATISRLAYRNRLLRTYAHSPGSSF